MKTLVTPLCTLEPQVEAHAARMFDVLCDPAIYEFERVPPPSVEKLAAGYRRLESRSSPDGTEQWLNWVVRLPSGELTGYVQATVQTGGRALLGYEFNSRYWRRGLATAALVAMSQELASAYGTSRLVAVVKERNVRSIGLLRKLGFEPGLPSEAATVEHESDERVYLACAPLQHAAALPEH